jgi:NAD(P)-dependent dehydrogenase (short-subunit alcohol dehydrogenase family)
MRRRERENELKKLDRVSVLRLDVTEEASIAEAVGETIRRLVRLTLGEQCRVWVGGWV